MREIKFRAWANGQMLYQGSFEFQQVGETVLGSRDKVVLWEFDGIESGENLFAPMGSGDHQIMQYTGLKDKNGLEIYEGDIFDTGHRVLFFEGSFCVTKHGTAGTAIGNWIYARDTAHVVGNIYENPELVKASSTPEGAQE